MTNESKLLTPDDEVMKKKLAERPRRKWSKKEKQKRICVGDIVLVHSNGSVWHDKKGFVEEIVLDPTKKGLIRGKQNPNHPRFSGKYSIYGLEKSNDGHWYFGDFVGQELELTGTRMNKPDLRDYIFLRKFSDPKVEHDIPIVIKNLGRCKGKNE